MTPQCKKILEHLDTHRGITSSEARDLYGIQRLASRMSDLKQMGYEVTGKMEYITTEHGEQIKYKRYFINKR